MASLERGDQLSRNNIEISVRENHFVPIEQHQDPKGEDFNFVKRGQWLRAAILGANDGCWSCQEGCHGHDSCWFCWASCWSL